MSKKSNKHLRQEAKQSHFVANEFAKQAKKDFLNLSKFTNNLDYLTPTQKIIAAGMALLLIGGYSIEAARAINTSKANKVVGSKSIAKSTKHELTASNTETAQKLATYFVQKELPTEIEKSVIAPGTICFPRKPNEKLVYLATQYNQVICLSDNAQKQDHPTNAKNHLNHKAELYNKMLRPLPWLEELSENDQLELSNIISSTDNFITKAAYAHMLIIKSKLNDNNSRYVEKNAREVENYILKIEGEKGVFHPKSTAYNDAVKSAIANNDDNIYVEYLKKTQQFVNNGDIDFDKLRLAVAKCEYTEKKINKVNALKNMSKQNLRPKIVRKLQVIKNHV